MYSTIQEPTVEYIVQFKNCIFIEIYDNSTVAFSANLNNGKRYHFLIDSETIYLGISSLSYNSSFEDIVKYLKKECFLFSFL